MSSVIANVLILAVVAVPVVAIAKASQFEFGSILRAGKRAVSFDPRHAGMNL